LARQFQLELGIGRSGAVEVAMLRRTSVALSGIMLATLLACGADPHDDDDGTASSPDQVGSICAAPEDCYPDAEAELQGEALCLDRVPDGYCTHTCEDDTDCCAVDGECLTDFAQVCSPFESAGGKMCFLSCEDEDVEAAGAPDEQSFCHNEVSSYFICRSSGGGSENRKICVPGDCGIGAACGEDLDCGGDLECLAGFDGGYCGTRDCVSDDECSEDARCVLFDNESFCVKRCSVDGDCGLCRPDDVAAACSDDVEFVDAGGNGAVCVPPPA
jgi:hypothetical protein